MLVSATGKVRLKVALPAAFVRTWVSPRAVLSWFPLSPGSAPTITTSANCRAPNQGDDLVLPDGRPCARLVVPSRRDHGLDGMLMMVDVLEGRATPWQYVLNKVGLLHTFFNGTPCTASNTSAPGRPRAPRRSFTMRSC